MIRQIAAIDTRRGIATDSGIPWNLPGDSAYFHAKTASGVILMGRATYNEFATPLHERENFVLTADSGPLRTGFQAVANLAQLAKDHPGDDIWIIGGATVYAGTIAESDELLLTQVVGDFHCTKFFPPYQATFRRADEGDDQRDGTITYRFETWQRLQPTPGNSEPATLS
jgi:dihydrofolate reductase